MDEFDSTSLLSIRELSLSEKIGIDMIPEQLVKKRIEEGFVFNILLVGETGIGKSTLVSSLFNIPPSVPVENHTNSDVKLKSKTETISEKSVNVKLTITETVGYGDQINREDNVTPVIHHIQSQFEKYFNEELKIKRSLSMPKDTRIHACIYFICPTGHNLKSLDVFCMTQLHDKVNLIPIIAKSDSLSADELKRFKAAIRGSIERLNIKIYHFPTDDEKLGDSNVKLNDMVPFAVATSRDYISVEGKKARARVLPWGTMLVENEEHSEFKALKRALIEVNMEDMRERTNDEFYEKYRETRLLQLGCDVHDINLLTSYELIEKLQRKQQEKMLEEEEKLRQKFAAKVKAKDEELKALETAMNSKYNSLFEKLRNEQESLNRLQKDLDLERFSFEAEVKRKRKCKNLIKQS